MSSTHRKVDAIIKEFLLIRQQCEPPSRNIIVLINACKIASNGTSPCRACGVATIYSGPRENFFKMNFPPLIPIIF